MKGAYLEPPSVAYPKKEDVDAAYVAMMEQLRGGGYTAIATHDQSMIDHAIAFTEREGIGRDRFEFQLLYGVRRSSSSTPRAGQGARGHPVRAGMVPVLHAPPGRAPGQPALPREEPLRPVATRPTRDFFWPCVALVGHEPRVAEARISSITGSSALPFLVSSYSTRRGGVLEHAVLLEHAQALESVRGLIPGQERSSSEKRRGPSERSWTMIAVHFEPMMSAVQATAHSSSWTGLMRMRAL